MLWIDWTVTKLVLPYLDDILLYTIATPYFRKNVINIIYLYYKTVKIKKRTLYFNVFFKPPYYYRYSFSTAILLLGLL